MFPCKSNIIILWIGIIRLFHYFLSRCSETEALPLNSFTLSFTTPVVKFSITLNTELKRPTLFAVPCLVCHWLESGSRLFLLNVMVPTRLAILIPSRYKLSIPSFSSSPVTAAAPASPLAPVALEWQQHIWQTQCHSTLLVPHMQWKVIPHSTARTSRDIWSPVFVCNMLKVCSNFRNPWCRMLATAADTMEGTWIYHCFQRLQPSVFKKILLFHHVVFCRKTCFPM